MEEKKVINTKESLEEMQVFLEGLKIEGFLQDKQTRVLFSYLLLALPSEYGDNTLGLLSAINNCISGSFPVACTSVELGNAVPISLSRARIVEEGKISSVLLSKNTGKIFYVRAQDALTAMYGKKAYFQLFLLVFSPHVLAYKQLGRAKREAVEAFLSPSLLQLMGIESDSAEYELLMEQLEYYANKYVKPNRKK